MLIYTKIHIPRRYVVTKTILAKLFKSNGFQLYHKISFGHDYSKTLMEWKKNFNNSWIKLKNLGLMINLIVYGIII